MDNKEIIYFSCLNYMIQNYNKLNLSVFENKEAKMILQIAGDLCLINMKSNKIIGLFVQSEFV